MEKYIFCVFWNKFFQDFGGQREARDLRPGHNGAIHRQRGPRREDQDMVNWFWEYKTLAGNLNCNSVQGLPRVNPSSWAAPRWRTGQGSGASCSRGTGSTAVTRRGSWSGAWKRRAMISPQKCIKMTFFSFSIEERVEASSKKSSKLFYKVMRIDER